MKDIVYLVDWVALNMEVNSLVDVYVNSAYSTDRERGRTEHLTILDGEIGTHDDKQIRLGMEMVIDYATKNDSAGVDSILNSCSHFWENEFNYNPEGDTVTPHTIRFIVTAVMQLVDSYVQAAGDISGTYRITHASRGDMGVYIHVTLEG